MICEKCSHMVVMHAFSWNRCEICNKETNTGHIPSYRLCEECAIKENRCQQCAELLTESTGYTWKNVYKVTFNFDDSGSIIADFIYAVASNKEAAVSKVQAIMNKYKSGKCDQFYATKTNIKLTEGQTDIDGISIIV